MKSFAARTSGVGRLRLVQWARLALALGAVVGVCLLAFSASAFAASGTVGATAAGCAALQAGTITSGAGQDAPDVVTDPSDSLDATRQCGGSPLPDQSRYEALLAGVGLVAFGGATLFYRARRHQHGPLPA